jgi:Subtilase family
MSELPFVPLPKVEPVERTAGLPKPPGRLIRPGRTAQVHRLGPRRFDRLKSLVGAPNGLAQLRSDPGSIAPERALVFELSGINPEAAYTALRNVPGFEFLGDDEEKFLPPEHGFARQNKKGEPTSGAIPLRLYFAMPSDNALRQLVSLWERYERGQPFNTPEMRGLAGWGEIFEHLIDVRPWGPQDRLPDDAVEAWKEDLAAFPDQIYKVEVEFWYRLSQDARKRAYKELERRVGDGGGSVLKQRVIEEIYYHGALIELPAEALRALIEEDSADLAVIDEVMFFRPQTLSKIPQSILPELPAYPAPEAATTDDQPLVALFDGAPLTGHSAIVGRIRLDDPENLSAKYASVAEMQHGTAMASIILNGDGHAASPVPHRLYVRPLLVALGADEEFPGDDLPVYSVHEALRRMLVGEIAEDGSEITPPAAPSVRIVNLSLGDPKRRFAGIVSPWARLIDYWAALHRILFVVSAGNIRDGFEVPGVGSYSSLEDMDVEDRSQKFVEAIFSDRTRRRLLSPAEAINALTVGARHHDELPVDAIGAGQIDPFNTDEMANVSSALGNGAARSVKPDILMSGGRETVQLNSSEDGTVRVRPVRVPGRFFGIGAAAPGSSGELNRMMNSSGTSPAASLATHQALRIEAVMRSMKDLAIPPEFLAVVLKALVAHGAAWNADVAKIIEAQATGSGLTAWQHKRVEKARFLGLGSPRLDKVLGCTQQRVLILGFGELGNNKTAHHDLPLPMPLSARAEWRSVTATLAWLTPIHPRHGAYRQSVLDLGLDGFEDGSAVGTEKVAQQPHETLGNKGTLIHRRWEGDDPAVFISDQGIRLSVACRSPTKSLDEVVPYSIAVTVEVAETSRTDVYTDIQTRIAARAPIVIKTS